MAKKRTSKPASKRAKSSSQSRSRASNAKKTDSQPKLAPGVGREVAALGVLAVGVLLLMAVFGIGGQLTDGVVQGLHWLFGMAVPLLPFLIIFAALRMFLTQEAKLHLVHYVGLVIILVSLSGLLTLLAGVDSLDAAREGSGGGVVGYGLGSGLAALVSGIGAAITLIVTSLIGAVLATNVTLAQLWQSARSLFSSDSEDADMAAQIPDTEAAKPSAAEKMRINAQVPLDKAGDEDKTSEASGESEALTASNDPEWTLPAADLLVNKQGKASAGDPEEKATLIEQTLSSFNIEVTMEEVNIGPTVTQFTLRPASGVKLSKITELEHNLALNLAAQSLRVEAPIPGKSAVGIEIPNEKTAVVRLREAIESQAWSEAKGPLQFVLGKGVAGDIELADLTRMPHLLVAGATGSGKSVMINSFLLSLLYRNSPADMKLILVDPKQVELSLYQDIPHLLSPVITEPEKCISALKWAVAEMERRYSVFAELGKRNIDEYNAGDVEERMPYITIAIDEIADLMMMAAQDMEALIVRLAQKARATGIHLVLATQRPSVNVITGLIKANIPARISFSTVSQVDSRTIIDQAGAEKLLGNGDMLFVTPELNKPQRIQGVYVEEKEVRSVTDYLREAQAPQYNDEVLNQQVKIGGGANALSGADDAEDELFMEAARLVVETGKASSSLIQRRLRVGYSRAARLLDMLEEQGVVSGPDGSRPREVLVRDLSELSDEEH